MITSDVIDSFFGEYRFLSNFWPAKVPYAGSIIMPTVEHAYVAYKCDVTDTKIFKRMCEMTAGQVKRFGRQLPMIEDWDEHKYSVMVHLIACKFSADNPELQEKLIATGDALLVEGNTWGDTYWGVCKGKGENHLGKILMKRRDYLQSL